MRELRDQDLDNYRLVTRPLDLVIGAAVLLIVAQVVWGFEWAGSQTVILLGDLVLSLLLIAVIARLYHTFVRLDVQPLATWPESVAAWAFLAVTVVISLAAVFGSLERVHGASAISAIGKAIIVAMVISLRVRALERLRTQAVQHAAIVRPAVTVVVSFAVAILCGWLLLSLPEATRQAEPIPVLDALFTATSATCVTGLIVQDTPNAFGRFGLMVILILIQAGGLGIMTLGGMFGAARGQRATLHQRLLAHDTLIIQEHGRFTDTLRVIAGYTFLCEAIGAALLFARWLALGETPWRALQLGVFHSISAFCNAGFSLFSNSLEDYTGDLWITMTVSLLILVGGIGFPVVFDLLNRLQQRRRGQRTRLSLHSRLVLVTTGCLLLLGFAGFLILEANVTLAPLSWGDRMEAAWFQTVTPRTAGFNTVPFGQLADATKFLIIILMFIGASPGSTGGGIKTSTLATLAALSEAMIYGRSGVHAFGREIPEAVRHRAVAIVILFGISILVWVFVLAVLERGLFIDLLFETVSAFATVGLSTGITPTLSKVGKVAITLAMYMGRVGPLTITLALGQRRRLLELRHPEEPVMVG